MTYRDDRDADRARIEALETELAGANKRIAELEGRKEEEIQALVLAGGGALALTKRPSASTTWLGAPLELELERDFEGAFPSELFEDLIQPCRTITRDSGRTEILKSSMTWSSSTGPKALGPFLVVTISVRDRRTRLAVGDRLGQVAGAIYGGVGGGVGGGTIILPLLAGAAIAPVVIPFALVAWVGGSMLGCRALYKRAARKRAAQMQRLFDALAEQIVDGIANASPKP
jgi:hypothetical protein